MSVTQTICALLEEIVQVNPDLSSVELLTYSPTPGLEERLSSRHTSALEHLFDEARRLRRTLSVEMQVPYWDSVLAMPMNAPTFDTIIDEALRHHEGAEYNTYSLPRHRITCAEIRERYAQLSEGESIAVTSRCSMTSGAERHIPMLDFRLPVSTTNTERICTIMRKIGQHSGAIVGSGRSYHYWGTQLFSVEEMQKLLFRAIMLSPLVDVRYIAHRLLQSYCVLRISPSLRNNGEPVVLQRL